jgi:hypothetical protein
MKRGKSLVDEHWGERFPDEPKKVENRIFYKKGDTFDIIADYDIADNTTSYYTILLDKHKKYTIIRKIECEILQNEPSNILTTCL